MWISQLGGEVELEVLKFHVGSLKSNKRMCYSCWAISKYLPQILGDLHRCLFVLSPPKCQIKVVKCLIFQNFGGFSKITWSKITWSAKPPLQFLAWNILLHLDFVLPQKMFKHALDWNLKPLNVEIRTKRSQSFETKSNPVMFQRKRTTKCWNDPMQLLNVSSHMINQWPMVKCWNPTEPTTKCVPYD